MKKRLLSLVMVLALAAGTLMGCGSKASDSPDVLGASVENGVTASKVNIAIQPSGAFIPLIIARQEGCA